MNFLRVSGFSVSFVPLFLWHWFDSDLFYKCKLKAAVKDQQKLKPGKRKLGVITDSRSSVGT